MFFGGVNYAKREFRRRLNDDQRSRTLPVTDPVIRTHPETGRKSFFANPQHTIVGEGCNEADSNVPLDDLLARYFKDELVYSQSWRVGDLVFWDNRCLAHVADHTHLDEPGYIRYLHGTSAQGGVPE